MLLLTCVLASMNIRSIKASDTICIRFDGSIDPPNSPISSVDNATYTITGAVSASIVVERDDIVVDGGGYALQGPGINYGFSLSNRNNVTIRNVIIQGFSIGIGESFSSGNTVTNNTILQAGKGIDLWFSNSTTISGNNVSSNLGAASGIVVEYSSSNTISDNMLSNHQNYGIILWGYSNFNNTIARNVIQNNQEGIIMSRPTDGNRLYDNLVQNNRYGIRLIGPNTVLRNNTMVGNVYNLDVGGDYAQHYDLDNRHFKHCRWETSLLLDQ